MPASWPPRSPSTRGRRPRRWPATTSPSPPSRASRCCGHWPIPRPPRRSRRLTVPRSTTRWPSSRDKALFTREGADGARQVNVRGLVATAFTHRDSRAGDPDLHTHVAVANKVQTLDGGKWLAIDGRLMFKAKVSASETYNTALERHLSDRLGLCFEERPNADARKRPVREIVGIDGDLNTRFSKRRHSVEARRTELAADFQRSHGRPPTPVETLHLAQQATLETRDAKHEPRTLAQQREAWHAEALEVMGSRQRLQPNASLRPAARPARPPQTADSAWVATAADRIVETMEGSRATWQYWHVYAEAQRQVRTAQHTHRPGGPARRVAGRGGPRRPVGAHHPTTRRHHRARAAAPRRRLLGLRGGWGPPVHLGHGARRRAASGGHRGPVRWVRCAGVLRRAGAVGIGRERRHPERRTGNAGAPDGHLRGTVAAGDRTRRVGQDHRDACPGRRVDRRGRQRRRAGALSCRRRCAEIRRWAPRIRHPDRHARQAHPLPEHRETPRLGGRHRLLHARGDRRGRDGRHPGPGRGGAVRPRARWQRAADRGRSAARRHRRRWRPARHPSPARCGAAERTGAVP